MNKYFRLMIVISSCFCFIFCDRQNDSGFDDLLYFSEDLSLPESSKRFGLEVAKELNSTIRNLHKSGANYSKSRKDNTFMNDFYKDYLDANPHKDDVNDLFPTPEIKYDNYIQKINTLSSTQLQYIDRIIKECNSATTDREYYFKLRNIANDIYRDVPQIQQERLFNIIAALYYGIKEIESLEEQGLMIPTPSNSFKHLRVKTKGEPGNASETCRHLTETVWVIAIGEPTPVGEIVASVLTVLVGAYLLYDVITCSVYNEVTVDCVEKYVECIQSGALEGSKCYDCFVYCQGQNVWDCPRPY